MLELRADRSGRDERGDRREERVDLTREIHREPYGYRWLCRGGEAGGVDFTVG